MGIILAADYLLNKCSTNKKDAYRFKGAPSESSTLGVTALPQTIML
jgi:hypothetical protein